jgi:hypothetical protein
VARWKKKDGLQDLYKARHFLDKYIELIERQQHPMAFQGNSQAEPCDAEHIMSKSLGAQNE